MSIHQFELDEVHMLRLYDYKPLLGEKLDPDNISLFRRDIDDFHLKGVDPILEYARQTFELKIYYEIEKIILFDLLTYTGE